MELLKTSETAAKSRIFVEFTKQKIKIEYQKLEELNIEFPIIESRESDMIFKCITKEGNPLAVHIEFQSNNDGQLPTAYRGGGLC
ncbi:hypothetical protein [Thermoanaerobacter pentosaceus]|uniref:Uncharacterized protein n=1 Tax=Thermoanaerobacter pentosaceus TaxID=694059 RepID=A0ABT9M2I8_9THEO|nr:hypothetical protein [Thermoanaerobacter pentosaceus]